MHTQVENPMVAGLASHYRAEQRRDEAAESAFESLRDDFIDAVLAGPETQIGVPGWGRHDTVAPIDVEIVDVIADHMAGVGAGDEHQRELLRILARCAAGKLDTETHLRASALVATMAAHFANHYAADLVDYRNGEA